MRNPVKVTELNGVVGLRVRVPLLEWHRGVKALAEEARVRDVVLEVIQAERLDDAVEPEPELEIVLWGSR